MLLGPSQVQLRPTSSAAHDKVRDSALRLLEADGLEYTAGDVPFGDDAFLAAHVMSMRIRWRASHQFVVRQQQAVVDAARAMCTMLPAAVLSHLHSSVL